MRPRERRTGALLVAALALAACSAEPEAPPNFLVIVADDLGCRDLGLYGDLWENPAPPPTPAIDGLAAEGVRFKRMIANPICCPSRITLVYGVYAHRMGVGEVIRLGAEYDVPADRHPSIATWLGERGYETSYFGKWHLSTAEDVEGLARKPIEHGFDEYLAGSIDQKKHYFDWKRSDNGEISVESTYSPTAQATACREWIEARTGERPWLAFLSFDVPHSPIHVPPAASLPEGYVPHHSPRGWYDALVVALDRAIGDVLEVVDREHTTILFVSDNGPGAEGRLPQQDPERLKGSLYREGVTVPCVIAGAGVSARGASTSALANTTDLFATIAALAGGDLEADAAPDSVSLLPLLRNAGRTSVREWALAERFGPNGEAPYRNDRRALVAERYKYLRRAETEELYDLESDPFETTDLVGAGPTPDQAAELERLRAVTDSLVGPYTWKRKRD